jgi:hypothetical protein
MDNNTYVATINFFTFDAGGNALNMFQNNETFRLSDPNNLVGRGMGFYARQTARTASAKPQPGHPSPSVANASLPKARLRDRRRVDS